MIFRAILAMSAIPAVSGVGQMIFNRPSHVQVRSGCLRVSCFLADPSYFFLPGFVYSRLPCRKRAVLPAKQLQGVLLPSRRRSRELRLTPPRLRSQERRARCRRRGDRAWRCHRVLTNASAVAQPTGVRGPFLEGIRMRRLHSMEQCQILEKPSQK